VIHLYSITIPRPRGSGTGNVDDEFAKLPAGLTTDSTWLPMVRTRPATRSARYLVLRRGIPLANHACWSRYLNASSLSRRQNQAHKGWNHRDNAEAYRDMTTHPSDISAFRHSSPSQSHTALAWTSRRSRNAPADAALTGSSFSTPSLTVPAITRSKFS
jgi:hypothetical protein